MFFFTKLNIMYFVVGQTVESLSNEKDNKYTIIWEHICDCGLQYIAWGEKLKITDPIYGICGRCGRMFNRHNHVVAPCHLFKAIEPNSLIRAFQERKKE